ncbi:putative gliotoxin efflux pump [Xylariaceae sp. FL1019]|nr:putative gliotoxin efflux pump [Xylariaceae sp. FL1019]
MSKITDESDSSHARDMVAEDEYPNPLRLTFIVASLVLSIFLASLDTTIITTAIPSITASFHSLQDVGWYGSAISFPIAATQSVWGKAYKYFPVKLVFVASILIFEIGSLICALSPNSPTFIAGRAIAGTGCAGTFAGCYILISLSSPPRLRPAFTSALTASFAVASVVGPLLGGAFTDTKGVGWRWCFYINLPLGFLSAVAITLSFRTPKAAAPIPATTREKILQLDIPGTVLISAAIVSFTLALRWAGVEKSWAGVEKSWADPDVISLLVATAVFFILFGVDQWIQRERALILPSILRNRVLVVGAVFEFFIAGCFNLALFYLPVYFQAILGASATSSGIRLIPCILSLTITQILIGGFITVTGIHNPFLITGPAIAAIGSGLFMLLDEQSTRGQWIGFQIVLGVGVGLCLSIPLLLSQVAVSTRDVSTATPFIIFAQSMSSAFLLPTSQAVFQNESLKAVRHLVPDINPYLVLSAGANSAAISTFSNSSRASILKSYTTALQSTFAVGIPFAGVALFVSFFMPWFRYQDLSGNHDVHRAVLTSEKVDGTEIGDTEEGNIR